MATHTIRGSFSVQEILESQLRLQSYFNVEVKGHFLHMQKKWSEYSFHIPFRVPFCFLFCFFVVVVVLLLFFFGGGDPISLPPV